MALLISGKMLRFFSLSLLIVAMFNSGCSPDGTKPTPGLPASESTPATPEKPEKDSSPEASLTTTSSYSITNLEREGIRVEIASWEEVQKFIAMQKGKIVVLDIWSTWCFPCVKEYPHLVALQKKYPKKVVCVSLNINYDGSKKFPPESNAEDVLDFLVEKKSKLHNFISSTPDEQLYEKLKLAAIPVAYVYATNGKLIKRFDNESQEYGKEGFSYDKNINPLVKQLLEEEEPQPSKENSP